MQPSFDMIIQFMPEYLNANGCYHLLLVDSTKEKPQTHSVMLKGEEAPGYATIQMDKEQFMAFKKAINMVNVNLLG